MVDDAFRNCRQSCLLCPNLQIYHINNSKFHGLCENHMNPDKKILQCIWCQSKVKQIFIQKTRCDSCSQEDVLINADCDHRLCKNCLFDKNSCKICKPCCCLCETSEAVNIYALCGHGFCENCENPEEKNLKNTQKCKKCFPKLCKNCRKNINHLAEDYCKECFELCYHCRKKTLLGSFFGCKHKECSDCAGKHDKCCILCKDFICSNCINNSLKLRKCKDHVMCLSCINEYWKKNCIGCKGENYYTCEQCKSIGITQVCEKKIHKLCLKCNTLFCVFCDYVCCVCRTINKGARVKQYNCGHPICEDCASANIKKVCMDCPNVSGFINCYNCSQKYQTEDNCKKQCEKCGKKICMVCGGKFPLIMSHVCYEKNWKKNSKKNKNNFCL